ncbi:MAG TPA: alpha/beta fold hydrolase [Rhodanobacteraceae bacterium]|nr:alpha/beta fold hydrolase [Rhodanobacteraceae bacterium]
MTRLIPLLALLLLAAQPAFAAERWPVKQGDFTIRDFHFGDGETLPQLRTHYRTLGTPARDPSGKVRNAVLILHGTSGAGDNFLTDDFAGVLFGPGQLLDASKYYIILPDGIGHGGSSKPSDGLRAHFPHYDYADMVRAQYALVTDGLHVNHLRLVAGTSMGCMHTWMWGESHPQFMDALMPLACLPVQIAGRNRMMRTMIMDAIRNDPAWNHGDYKQQPRQGMTTAIDILMLMISDPQHWHARYPTRDQADAYLHAQLAKRLAEYDANDLLYQFDASRTYDPSAQLDRIEAPVMAINSADDQVNPPELNIMPKEIKKVRHGRYVLLPISDQTQGHHTHSLPIVWKRYLAELLKESQH